MDAVWDSHPELSGSHQSDTVDMAHVRWAVGSAITALDLCAAALGQLYCKPTNAREFDLRDFDINTRKHAAKFYPNLPRPASDWVDGVLADPRYQTVLNARNSLTHSRLLRHLRISFGGEPMKDRMDFKISINGNQIQIGASDLVLQSRDLAGQHVDHFLRVYDAL